MEGLEHRLDALERDGFLLVEGALTCEETDHVRRRIDHARALVAHTGIRPILDGMMGRQCQLRSFRAHVNPGPYVQEWHMDFYGYWEEKRRAEAPRLATPPVGVNTTFYMQDNDPGQGHLKFIKDGHKQEPPHLSPMDRPKFEAWCQAQEHVVLYPKAGDCVVFISHIPHQGAKERDDMERSNVVCHYQVTPMYEGAWFVSQARGYQGTFPLAQS